MLRRRRVGLWAAISIRTRSRARAGEQYEWAALIVEARAAQTGISYYSAVTQATQQRSAARGYVASRGVGVD